MATIPSYVNWVDGTVTHGSDLNSQVRDPGNFFLARPYCNLFRSAALSITNAAGFPTAVSWDAEVEDNDNMHSTGTNPTRLIFQTTGVYLINAAATWLTLGTSTDRRIQIRLNSAGSSASGTFLVQADQTDTSSAGTNNNGTPTLSFYYRAVNVGDYIEMFVGQSSATTPLAMGVGAGVTFLQAMWQIA